MSDFITEVGIWIAAFLTLAVYSFAYRDNPVFKFAEHTYVGAAVGYAFVSAVRSVKVYGIDKLAAGDAFYILPILLGVFLYARYHSSLYWAYRYGIAVIVGTSITTAFSRSIEADFIRQIRSTANLNLFSGDALTILGNISLVLAVVTVLYFFIFTFPVLHQGSLGYIPRLGRWFMMISFGYSFANTVVSRYNLMIGRLQFLLFDWLKIHT